MKHAREDVTDTTDLEGADKRRRLAVDKKADEPEHTSSHVDSEVAQSTVARQHLKVEERKGDLFAAESGTILVHACNCQGSWAAGIAAAFKAKYPAAFGVYASHCKEHGKELLGTCLLIKPQADSKSKIESERGHWIGCLFTSQGKGKTKGSKESILEATDSSLRDLLLKMRSEGITGNVNMCKINSGLFRVEWARTKAVVEAIERNEGDIEVVEVISQD